MSATKLLMMLSRYFHLAKDPITNFSAMFARYLHSTFTQSLTNYRSCYVFHVGTKLLSMIAVT